jgi:hypothetical protein
MEVTQGTGTKKPCHSRAYRELLCHVARQAWEWHASTELPTITFCVPIQGLGRSEGHKFLLLD